MDDGEQRSTHNKPKSDKQWKYEHNKIVIYSPADKEILVVNERDAAVTAAAAAATATGLNPQDPINTSILTMNVNNYVLI